MRRENGNALFLILIAVALFAALSYAVTRSGRGGGTIDKETVALATAEITQWASSVEQTVRRLKMVNGCTDNQISFENPVRGWANPRAPADKSCHVFDPAGGGLEYKVIPTAWIGQLGDSVHNTAGLTPADRGGWVIFSGDSTIPGVGEDPMADVILHIAWLDRDICLAVNKAMGVSGIPAGYFWTEHALGPFMIREPPTPMENLTGIPGILTGCVGGTVANGSGYQFFHVLIAR